MRRYFILASAALALASCSSDDFIGKAPGSEPQSSSSAIMFDGGTGKITRANEITGKKAAELLGNKFYVLGTKGSKPTNSPTSNIVFDNYQVNWTENSAGTTTDNTNDWNYVGITPPGLHAGTAAPTSQTLKYWDYGETQYDFIAYSIGKNYIANNETPTKNNIVISSINTPCPTSEVEGTTVGNGNVSYTLKAADLEDLANCYYTDIKTVRMTDGYGKPVSLTFKSVVSKVRVAFYETIPGYSVSDIHFYTNDTDKKKVFAENEESSKTAILFLSGDNKVAKKEAMVTAKVKYPNVGVTNITTEELNTATIETTVAENDLQSTLELGTVNYKDGSKLATSAMEACKAGDDFTLVLPSTGSPLTLRVNYTLTSDDGSGETIHIYGAKAVIPAIYTGWKPNTAYTYIFKISDNTNGSTNIKDIGEEGLFPITFDAVVEADENGNFNENEYITTVATPSVTCFAYNTEYSYIIKALENQATTEYPYSQYTDVYFSVSDDDGIKTDLNTKAKMYVINKATATEAEVIDALQFHETGASQNIIGRNGLELESINFEKPTGAFHYGGHLHWEEGSVIKFNAYTPYASFDTKTYAFVYNNGNGNDVEKIMPVTVNSDDIVANENEYFTDKECQNAVAANTTLIKGQTYYKKYATNSNVYAVKVIKTYEPTVDSQE